MTDVEGLLPFCESDAQRRLIQAIVREGSIAKAGVALDINRRNVQRMLVLIRTNAARRGYAPESQMTRPVSPAHVAETSTMYDADGNVKLQWVKAKLSTSDAFQALQEAIQQAADEYRGVAKPVKAPARSDAELLTVYPMGDPHVGMYAWKDEAGEDFDCDIARQDLLSATSRLVQVAPGSERALIVNLGDFFHSDNNQNRTSRSGHALDVDTRWPRVLKVGCQIMIDLVGLALRKHQRVEVINAIGNHDDHSSVMLSAFMEAFFHKEPRVLIHAAGPKFHYVTHGRVLIGVTHGDTVKPAQLGGVMAADQGEAWGLAEHRHWLTGHIHHSSKLELPGCTVESFRTLASRDAWATAAGYRAGRDMVAIAYHREFGEVERYRCDIRMARSDG